MHVSKEQRSKLDDKTVLHVFVVYGGKVFGFKLWDQTLGDFDKTNQSKGTSDEYIQLVPIPLSLKLPRNEDEEINELPRDDSASDIPV